MRSYQGGRYQQNSYGQGYQQNNYGRGGMQVQAQMYNQEQAQEQAACNDVLCQLMSTAEAYALGPNAQRVFRAYEIADSSRKDKSMLRNQLLIMADSFRQSVRFFKAAHHGEYQFPSNLSPQNIVGYLRNWESYVPIGDKRIYESIIEIVSGTGTGNLNLGANDFAPVERRNDVQVGNYISNAMLVQHSNTALQNDVKREIRETGKYTPKAILGAQSTSDPYLLQAVNDKKRVPGRRYGKPEDDDGMDFC